MADLEGRGYELVKHNLANDRPSRELLARLIDEHGVHAMMNARSPAYKARGLGARTLSKSEAVALMLEDPNLIRRPLVLGKRRVVFGHKPEEYEGL